MPNRNIFLSIIVVSFNTKELTLKCIESVYSQMLLTDFEVIVFDNASTDGTVEALRDRFGCQVSIIANQTNIGFACANNEAIRLAAGEYILLLNPDTVVIDNAIDKLLSFAGEYPLSLIWGGRTTFADGRLNPASCWGRQTLWSLFCQAIGFSTLFKHTTLFNPEGIGGWNRLGVRYVDIVSGCFLLITRDFWDKLGGFLPDFFMYGEEADLCLRAKQMGARPIVTSDATIIHLGGASEKVFADKIVRLLNAKRKLVDRHFHRRFRSLGIFLFALWPIRRYISNAIFAIFWRNRFYKSSLAWKEALYRFGEWIR